jgi:hypothetical protein
MEDAREIEKETFTRHDRVQANSEHTTWVQVEEDLPFNSSFKSSLSSSFKSSFWSSTKVLLQLQSGRKTSV